MKTSSSLAGSLDHANHTAQPENGWGKKMNATSGQKCLERFERFNHVGSWAKTFSALLIGRTDWYSTRCKLTWKLKGTKYNRLYFQLAPSTLPIGETGFGLLPTVKTWDSKEHSPNSGKETKIVNGQAVNIRADGTTFGPLLMDMAKVGLLPTPTASEVIESKNPREVIMKGGSPRVVNNQGTDGQAKLNDMARWGLLPTPTAMDSSGATANMKSTQVKDGSMHSVTLSRALGMGLLPTPTAVQREHPERVEALKASGAQTMFSRANGEARPNSILDHMHFHGMLPTPCARDFKGDRTLTEGKNITADGQEMGLTLEQSARIIAGIPKATSSTSQLNPRFVMEMMGFPPDWTELPFLNGGKSLLKPEEML